LGSGPESVTYPMETRFSEAREKYIHFLTDFGCSFPQIENDEMY